MLGVDSLVFFTGSGTTYDSEDGAVGLATLLGLPYFSDFLGFDYFVFED